MTFEMMDTPRTIRVYNFSSHTGEFIGVGNAFIPEHTGLPAHSTDIAPPEAIAGFVPVFDLTLEKWSMDEDHRGMTVFDKQTGQPVSIENIGPLPENTVGAAPGGQFMKWDGKKWVPDSEAETKALTDAAARLKSDLLAKANNAIAPLQDAVDLDIATDDETARLLAWKKYRVMLNRVDTSKAPDVEWPDKPDAS